MVIGKNKTNVTKIIFFILSMIVLLVLRDVFHMSITKNIFILVACVWISISSVSDINVMLSFIFPLMIGLPWGKIFIFAGLVILIKTNKISYKVLGFSIFFMLLELVSIFWSKSWNIGRELEYIITIIYFYYYIYLDENMPYKKCIYSFFVGCVTLCGIIVVHTIKIAPVNWFDYYIKGLYRFGYITSSLFLGVNTSILKYPDIISSDFLQVNPNGLAYYSIAGLVCIPILLRESQRVDKIVLFLGGVILFLGGAFSVGKTWMILVVLYIALLIGNVVIKRKVNVKNIMLLLTFLITMLIVLSKNIWIVSAIFLRLQNKNLTTGRIDVLVDGFIKFFNEIKYLLTGVGAVDSVEKLGLEMTSHSMIQQVVISYGLLGTVVFIIGTFGPVVKLLKKKPIFIAIIPWILVSIYLQSTQFLNTQMLPYAVTILILKQGLKEKLKKDNLEREVY